MSGSAEFLLNPDIYDAVFQQVVDRVGETTEALIDAFQDDGGRVAGQVPLRREDRVLWTLDFIQSGAMQWLSVINPDVAQDLLKTYENDLRATGMTA